MNHPIISNDGNIIGPFDPHDLLLEAEKVILVDEPDIEYKFNYVLRWEEIKTEDADYEIIEPKQLPYDTADLQGK